MMQEMNVAPSQSPSFPPTNQPVAEAPPAPDAVKPGSTAAIVAGALVGVAICAALAVIFYRKYQPRAPQQGSELETDDVEKLSALALLTTDSSSSYIAKKKDDDDALKRKALDDAFDRSVLWFPALLHGRRREHISTMQRLKRLLRGSLENILLANSSLSERINGPSLFLELGMDKKMVEERFKALIAIEKELGIFGKSSFVDTVDLLIQYIDVKNPFGAVNDEIQELGGNENFSHICVRMERGNISSAIELVKNKLDGKKWSNLFMHGTKASVAEKIVQNPRSLPDKTGRHDFGNGLYCFRSDNDLIAPLASAVDRSFYGLENPCVIAFPEPFRDIDKRIIDVHTTTIKKKTLRNGILDDGEFNLLRTRQRQWKEEEGEQVKNWKTALAIARWHGKQPEKFYRVSQPLTGIILKGWLHDDKATPFTDEGADPKIDADGWIQFCVTDPALLGKKKVFIEFQMEWKQWAEDNETVDDRSLISVNDEISILWRNYMQDRVNRVQ